MNAFTCLSSQVHIFLSRPDIVVERIISLCPAKTRNNDWIWQLQLLFALVENVRQLYSHCTKKKRQNTILPIEKKKKKNNVVGQFTVLPATRKPLLDNLLYRVAGRANQDASF